MRGQGGSRCVMRCWLYAPDTFGVPGTCGTPAGRLSGISSRHRVQTRGVMSEISGRVGEGVHLHWGIKIPLRDGVRLNATLYLPKNHTTPSPVIFTLTPYIGQTYHD